MQILFGFISYILHRFKWSSMTSISEVHIVCWMHRTARKTFSWLHKQIGVPAGIQLGGNHKALIARFMGPTWGPYGADSAQVVTTLAPWTLLSGRRMTWVLTDVAEHSCESRKTCRSMYEYVMWLVAISLLKYGCNKRYQIVISRGSKWLCRSHYLCQRHYCMRNSNCNRHHV